MRQILSFLTIIIIGIVALGFYRGWFGVTTEGADGQHRITLTVDGDKIKADEKRAQEKLPAIGQSTTKPEPVKN